MQLLQPRCVHPASPGKSAFSIPALHRSVPSPPAVMLRLQLSVTYIGIIVICVSYLAGLIIYLWALRNRRMATMHVCAAGFLAFAAVMTVMLFVVTVYYALNAASTSVFDWSAISFGWLGWIMYAWFAIVAMKLQFGTAERVLISRVARAKDTKELLPEQSAVSSMGFPNTCGSLSICMLVIFVTGVITYFSIEDDAVDFFFNTGR